MQAKKRQVNVIPVPELKSHITEIIVANGRSFQPFIRTFQYSGENITKSSLGTLIGVFEIDELTEDCAYIVNFLTSVARKEYFSNPRRGAIESFESALHKINLTLSELVKHGNVTWLGKLHGTIGVLEKNNFHFSVTGQAAILLLRNNDISDISTGLASPESHLHPIKTFVEVSSGRLNINDRLLLTSPELLALFSLAELTKNANRMDNERFIQFLKTALVNELDMAGTVLVEVINEVMIETRASKKTSPEKSLDRISNIFSQSAFLPKSPAEPLDQEAEIVMNREESPETNEEYVDAKTGHIYIQGETPDQPRNQHAQLEQFTLGLENLLDNVRLFLLSQKKWFRKGKKQFALATTLTREMLHVVGKKVTRGVRHQWKKLSAHEATLPTSSQDNVVDVPNQQSPRRTYTVSDIPLPENTPLPPHKIVPIIPEADKIVENTDPNTSTLPKFLKEKLVRFYGKQSRSSVIQPASTQQGSTALSHGRGRLTQSTTLVTSTIKKMIASVPTTTAGIVSQINNVTGRTVTLSVQTTRQYCQTLPSSKKRLVLGAILICFIFLGGFIFWPTSTPSDAIPDNTKSGLVTPSPATPSTDVSEPTVVWDSIREPIIATIILNGEVSIVTEKSILTTANKQSYPIPGMSPAKFATAMDDLRLVFVVTDSGSLYAWSPISKTFIQNTLALVETAKIVGIDTYLTYLYVLDSSTNQVYRFPRAANGFGTGVPWLKETVVINETARLAVNESLFIAPDATTIKGFFRGRGGDAFELPDGLTITDLYTHPGLQNVYALDSEHRRIVVWNQDGKLIKEITHARLSEGQTLSVNEKNSEIFVSTDTALLLYTLK